MNYYMITNVGTLLRSTYAQTYPRHLALAPMICKNPAHAALIMQMARRGTRIILDNGAHEGITIDEEVYLDVAVGIQPSIVVLPDVVGWPAEKSRARGMRFHDRAMKTTLQCEYMYALQGSDPDDALRDYQWAITHLDPLHYVIGLGQVYLLWEKAYHIYGEEARVRMMQDMASSCPIPERYRFHILGARWAPPPSPLTAVGLDVVGIDSIKPCHCAANDLVYPNKPTRACSRMSNRRVPDRLLRLNVAEFGRLYGAAI